jgi:CheY-like chemotaxis protein
MAQPDDGETILVIDDEPFNMPWMEDYFAALGYSVKQCVNLNEGMDALDEKKYRAAIIDLSIPALEPMDLELTKTGGAYRKYPGLYAARFARTKGYRDRQVIIYSVHPDNDVRSEANILGCTYIIKGRPKAFTDELEAVLAYDPTKD